MLTLLDDFWTSLTPEKAFLARVFVEHCIANKDETRLEDTIPVVTSLAFRIQDEYNSLVSATNEGSEDMPERAFIVRELLVLALNLDYADEIGRRKMFQLSRTPRNPSCSFHNQVNESWLTLCAGEMISQANLPEPLIPKCMEILHKIANSERDLIRVVVDVVSELREGDGDEEELDQVGTQNTPPMTDTSLICT